MRKPSQVWWITGAGAGIGRELALRLAADGHHVYATARTLADLESLAAVHPQHITPLQADVSDAAAMAALWQTLPAPPAALDGVILAAGICEYVDAPVLDAASFRRVMDVNFHGVVQACSTALPLLLAAATRNPGEKPILMGVGSLSSVVGLPRAEAYGASKAAMHYFLDALRCDLGHRLAITVVHPGFVATRLTARNDFAMPFLWTTQKAGDYLHERLWSRRRNVRFPWQLSLILTLASWLPGLWYGVMLPRMRRTASLPASGVKQ
jgi:NAD(P)-dependent dehydrogenase (short-subunit alcohol dehydrogenase family)